jgi:hypothetical protein
MNQPFEEESINNTTPSNFTIQNIILYATATGFFTAEMIALFASGLEDQIAFLIFTTPWLLIVGASATALTKSTSPKHPIILSITLAAIGGFAGLLYTYLIATMMGPWFGAFGIPVALCWIAGSATAAFTPSALMNLRSTTAIRAMIFCVVISFMLAFCVALIAQSGQVTVVVIRHIPGPNPPNLDIITNNNIYEASPLTPEEITQIRQHLNNGEIHMEGGLTFGPSKPLKVVLVLQEPIHIKQLIQLPASGTVFVIQQTKDWLVTPTPNPSSKYKLELTKRTFLSNGNTKIATDFLIYKPDGGRTGANALTWD